MAAVSDVFQQRWAGRRYVGTAKPVQRVWVRLGRFQRGYKPWDDPDGDARDYAVLPGQPPGKPWQATWEPIGEWAEIPGVSEVRLDKDFAQNGIQVATLVVDNVRSVEKQGIAGVYHEVERGYLSPWRGYKSTHVEEDFYERGPQAKRTEWYKKLSGSCEIAVEQSYGEEDEPPCTYTGLIDDLDIDSQPDRLTITARCFGQTLTDQRLFGWVKDKAIRDPVIFADRLEADETKAVGGGADASSSRPGYPPRFVSDESKGTFWQSQSHTSAAVTEWVEVRLPKGRYETVQLHAWISHEAYVGIYGRDVTVDGEPADNGWIDVGEGDVPGEHGGWPYMVKVKRTKGSQQTIRLGHIVELGDDSVLRVGFRNLRFLGGGYRAGCHRLKGVRRKRSEDAKKKKWILVDDASDVIRVVFRWAGFKEWEVEDTGVRLTEKATYGRSTFLIDLVREMSEKTGFVFFMGDPTSRESLGVPTFRYTRAAMDLPNVPQITESDTLHGLQTKLSKEPLAYIIRVRGKAVERNDGGVQLGGDTSWRVMADYRPPWSHDIGDESDLDRLGGILRHVTHTDQKLTNEDECLIMCYLIALGQALKSATGVMEIPGHAGVELDGHIAVFDEGAGFNTRLWIANRSSTFTSGRQTKWTTNLGGALIDTPDIVAIKRAMDREMPDPRTNDRGRPRVVSGERQ